MAITNDKTAKTEFIRARPGLTPQEISAEAETFGLDISPQKVWTTRSKLRAEAGSKQPKVSKKKVSKKAAQVADPVQTKESNDPNSSFNKSEFIRKHPNQKAGEIVAAAAALGQTIAKGLVYSIRNTEKKKVAGAVPAKKVAKKAAKRVSTPVQAKKPIAVDSDFNKSEFIRKHPNQTAREIVAAAAAMGQTIAEGLIYSVRSTDKKNAGASAAPAKKTAKKTAKKVAKKTAKIKIHKPEAVVVAPVSRVAAVANGHRVTVVVYDPRDAQGVKEANKRIREAVASV